MITPDSNLINIDQKTFHKYFGFSIYKPNSRLHWLPTDTEYLFDKNMKNKSTRRSLESAGWTKDSIRYQFNNYGFRSDDDFDIENPLPGNIFLGDSFTDGVGLNIEDTWGYKLNQRFGGIFYNLGQGGTGIDAQYRLFKAWAPLVKPKKAFTIGSLEPRREFITPTTRYQVAFWDDENKNFFQKCLSHDSETIISYHRTLDAIKKIAQDHRIELYSLSAEIQSEAAIIGKQTHYARDLIHYGPAYHDYLVNNFDKWIQLV